MQVSANGAQADDMLVVGRIAAPYGVKGWLRVTAFTELPENLLEYLPWYLHRGGEWREMQPLVGKCHGKGLVVRFADCNDRDAAAALSGTDIAIKRCQLPDTQANEYYWRDLIGLQVVTVDNVVLGRVDHLLETGANDVLVVRGDRERLVPFIRDDVIRAVDLAAGEIRVDWDPEF
ncbi:MAG: ribosome maturation factor RimM [Gammaproteobacteria bacterium]|nr:ribosome maturation factor RimM [Gammaproteobacteria bacterium]MDH5515096.1 ribosome maturation factor RimM [Gammaproteobacteria bacterium]